MNRKQTFLLSVISGVLLSLPWLFQSMGWVLFFALVPLLAVEDQLSRPDNHQKGSFFNLAFLVFLIWNVLSTWWISYVSFTGMIIVAVLNTALMAAIWWLIHLVRIRFGVRTGYFSLVVFWLGLEYMQHHWAIPWPWLTLGNGFANSVQIIQWYEFTGVLGGSLWVLLANILIFLAAKSFIEKLYLISLRLAGIALIVVFLPLFASLNLYSGYSEKGKVQNMVVLQPNIDPYTQKFSSLSSDDQLRKLLTLAESAITDSTDILVAPETALPSMWEDSVQRPLRNKSLIAIADLLQKYPNTRFIGGAITQRKQGIGEALTETARRSADNSYYYDVFNSALMIDRNSDLQISHKCILVNGVERMPFQKYFSFFGKYVLDLGGTSGSLGASDEPVLFSGKIDVTIGPVICFESVFGEYTGKMVKRGANLLVVITNDGWWKDSPGTWQHFGYSRIRAIETRRSIAHCANTGISGFINQRGDVLKKTTVNTCDALSSPVQLNREITFFVSNGDYLGKISTLLSVMVLISLMAYRMHPKLTGKSH